MIPSPPKMIEHAAAAPFPAVDDQEKFLALLEQHSGIVHKVVAGYSARPADRHDLTQEIILQLWKAYPRYAADRPFSTWMYRISLNVAISALRRQTHPSRQTISLEQVPLEFAEERAEVDERVPLLQKVIASLPGLDRALLLLYLDDQSYREIAAVLGISETNVATKLSRIKQTVRRKIEQLTTQ